MCFPLEPRLANTVTRYGNIAALTSELPPLHMGSPQWVRYGPHISLERVKCKVMGGEHDVGVDRLRRVAVRDSVRLYPPPLRQWHGTH